MSLTIPLPSQLEAFLRQQLGEGLERTALEKLAVVWFNEGQISSRQVASMLGLSWYEAQAFLKQNGGVLTMTIEEVRQEAASILENQ